MPKIAIGLILLPSSEMVRKYANKAIDTIPIPSNKYLGEAEIISLLASFFLSSKFAFLKAFI